MSTIKRIAAALFLSRRTVKELAGDLCRQPATVRKALERLRTEGTVTRQKRLDEIRDGAPAFEYKLAARSAPKAAA